MSKHKETFDRDEFRRRMRGYRPCHRFMEGGALYGRGRQMPRVAGRVKRIFKTCIHIRLVDQAWFRTSSNALAYNSQELYPLFAYQFRPECCWSTPPPSRKETTTTAWREAA